MKGNQPELLAAVADAFGDDDAGVSPRERRLAAAERPARSTGKGHGRAERRTLTSTTALSERTGGKEPYLDRPGLGQCFRLTRERTANGGTTSETVFGITSLTRGRADAKGVVSSAQVRSHTVAARTTSLVTTRSA